MLALPLETPEVDSLVVEDSGFGEEQAVRKNTPINDRVKIRLLLNLFKTVIFDFFNSSEGEIEEKIYSSNLGGNAHEGYLRF